MSSRSTTTNAATAIAAATTDAKVRAVRVQRDFDRWRRRRRRGARIPNELWRAATDVARELGVSKIAQLLRLDYYSLKERVEATACDPAPFVEVPFAPGPFASAGVLEIAGTRGDVCVRMNVQGMSADELGCLVRAVVGAER